MPYTMEDFRREVAREYMGKLTLEERLSGLSPKEILEHLSDDEIQAYLAKRHKKHSNPKKPKRRSR